MATDLQTYSRLLAEQLRISGMKESQVSEVVAQMQHHVRDTGQDPVESFGEPGEYARQWVLPSRGHLVSRMFAAAAGITSLLALASGFAGPEPWMGPVDITSFHAFTWATWVLSLGVLPWTVDVWLARRRGLRSEAAGGIQDWLLRVSVIAASLAVLWVVFVYVLDADLDRLLFTIPRWGLVVLGVICLPGLPFIATGHRASVPEPPGPVTWKTRVRRAFINR